MEKQINQFFKNLSFDNLKTYLPIIVIICSFLYNLFKRSNKQDELSLFEDGSIAESFEDMMSGETDIRYGKLGGASVAHTNNKWIKVATFYNKTPYGNKALTLDVYPRHGPEHGTTRQTFSIISKNSVKKPFTPIIYEQIHYGDPNKLTFKDIAVL